MGSFAVGLLFRGGFFAFQWYVRGLESFNMDILIIAVFKTRSRVQNKNKTKNLFHARLKFYLNEEPKIKNKKSNKFVLLNKFLSSEYCLR